MSPSIPGFLSEIITRVKNRRAGRRPPVAAAANSYVGPEWERRRVAPAASAAAAAPAAGKCPSCAADCEEPQECRVCEEPCCLECAPGGICENCVVEDQKASNQTAASGVAAAPPAILETRRLSARSVLLLEDGTPRHLFKGTILPSAAPQSLFRLPAPLPTAVAAVALPVAAPVAPVFSASAEIAKLEACIPITLCPEERYRMQEHIGNLESGVTTRGFLTRKEIEERQIVLEQEQSRAKTSEEKLRIGAQIDQLERGEYPGPFVPTVLLDGRVAALEASLATETDSAAIWDTLAHIEAIKAGKPFVSREEKKQQQSQLVAQLEACTCPEESYRIVEKINVLWS